MAVALLALPAAAGAATVSSDGTTATYTAAAGEDDAVAITAGGITFAAGDGDADVDGRGLIGGGRAVTCPGATRVVAALGDGNDNVDAGTAAVPTTADGGDGRRRADRRRPARTCSPAARASTCSPAAPAATSSSRWTARPTGCRAAPGGDAQFDPADAVTAAAARPTPSLTDARRRRRAAPARTATTRTRCATTARPTCPSNGVDEDCDGKDYINLDVDGDGYKRPDDCNDRNPKIKPNAVEKRGNKVDENCDGRLQDFFPMDVLVTNSWAYSATQTRVNRLIVRGAPKRARITVRCDGKSRGCPFKRKRRKVSRRQPRRGHHALFRGARLRPGAKLRLGVKASNFIAVTVTLTVRSLDVPTLKRTCREGKKKAKAC